MEQTKAIALSILIFLSGPSRADSFVIVANGCADVAPIKKGAPAPCDGFYFPGDTEKQAEEDRANADYYKSLSDSLQKKSDLQTDESQVLEKRLKLYMDETQTLSQDVAKRDSNETWIRLGYFVLGVLGTSLVVRNLRQ